MIRRLLITCALGSALLAQDAPVRTLQHARSVYLHPDDFTTVTKDRERIVTDTTTGDTYTIARHDLVKPTITLASATKMPDGQTKYVYEIANGADALEAINLVAFDPYGRNIPRVSWSDREGVAPGANKIIEIFSEFGPGNATALIQSNGAAPGMQDRPPVGKTIESTVYLQNACRDLAVDAVQVPITGPFAEVKSQPQAKARLVLAPQILTGPPPGTFRVQDKTIVFKAPGGETVELSRDHHTKIDGTKLPETFRTAEWVDFIENILHTWPPPDSPR